MQDMTMIVVSSFDSAAQAYRKYRPRYVVSILGDDEGPTPCFDDLPADHHIELRGDCSNTDNGSARCRRLIALAESWDRSAPILIHCQQGVARSMAAAYILLCVVEKDRCEKEIARRLRRAAPHADPNLLLISQADALLDRHDRMVEAILEIEPCAGAVCNDIVTLPLAA